MAKFVKIGSSGQLQEEASVGVSAGAAEANKLVHLNSSGKIDNSFIPTSITNFFDPVNGKLGSVGIRAYTGSYNLPGSSLDTSYGTATALVYPRIALNNVYNKQQFYNNLSSSAALNSIAARRLYSPFTWGTFFDSYHIFGIPSTNTPSLNSRLFIGISIMMAATSETISNKQHLFGLVKEAGETNFSIMSRNTGAVTTVALGSNFPATTAATPYLVRFTWLSSTSFSYYVRILGTSNVISGVINSNFINTNNYYYLYTYLDTNSVASVTSIDTGPFWYKVNHA